MVNALGGVILDEHFSTRVERALCLKRIGRSESQAAGCFLITSRVSFCRSGPARRHPVVPHLPWVRGSVHLFVDERREGKSDSRLQLPRADSASVEASNHVKS